MGGINVCMMLSRHTYQLDKFQVGHCNLHKYNDGLVVVMASEVGITTLTSILSMSIK